jgi:hypothetical protein
MPRPRKNVAVGPSLESVAGHFGGLAGWAEALGHALGEGVARGLNGALAHVSRDGAAAIGPRKRGRPAKPFVGLVSAGDQCSVAGCGRPARSKGLCSAHYQAARRKKLAKA